MAWQFDRPDLGEGMVQVFRRGGEPLRVGPLPAPGTGRRRQYTLTDLDTGRTEQFTGRQLMQDGLSITVEKCPQPGVALRKGAMIQSNPRAHRTTHPDNS